MNPDSGQPDTTVSVREKFAIDSDMMVPAFGQSTEHVPVIDPDYLTEPLVRSAIYVRAPTLQLPTYPCQPEDDRGPGEPYRAPHYLVEASGARSI